MHEGLHSLSGREVDVLRLLLTGHDAKSVARELGLSVHTVNDRLRDARRKLGVSSSREAARLLAMSERQGPQFLAAEKFGVPGGAQAAGPPQTLGFGPDFHAGKKMGLAGSSLAADSGRQSGARERSLLSPGWLGGMAFMAIIVAALGAPSVFQTGGRAPVSAAPAAAQRAIDLMPLADADRDGKVSAQEYDAFSRQGWRFASKGKDAVRWAELDAMARVGMLGIVPDAEGAITRRMVHRCHSRSI